MLNVELKVVSGKQSGNVIELPAGKFLIGREHDCHLRPNSELISRHHCAFTVDDYTVRVRDLGSTNGTLVNGERIRGATILNPGDLVSVGKLAFQVIINGEGEVSKKDTVLQAGGETLVELPQDESDPARHADTLTDFQVSDSEEGAPAKGKEVESDTHYLGEETSPATAPPPSETPVPPGYADPAAAPPPQAPQVPYGYPPPEYAYPPQQYAYPPAYPPPAPQYPGYPYPGQPQAYPPPPQPAAPPEQPTAPQEGKSIPEVRLPDPSTTGAKPPEPEVKDPNAETKDDNSQAHIPTAAKDIINQYLNRRPKSE